MGIISDATEQGIGERIQADREARLAGLADQLPTNPAAGNNDPRFEVLVELYSAGAGGNATLAGIANDLGTLAANVRPDSIPGNLAAFLELLRGEVDARAHYERLHP